MSRPYTALVLGGGAMLAFIAAVWALTTRDMAAAVAHARVVAPQPGSGAAAGKGGRGGSGGKKKGQR